VTKLVLRKRKPGKNEKAPKNEKTPKVERDFGEFGRILRKMRLFVQTRAKKRRK
jgi:hypothetical protein